jgi:hypothetical protein
VQYGNAVHLNRPSLEGLGGGIMKKTYNTPTVVVSGDLIVDTRGVTDLGEDPGINTKAMAEGSVGYDL